MVTKSVILWTLCHPEPSTVQANGHGNASSSRIKLTNKYIFSACLRPSMSLWSKGQWRMRWLDDITTPGDNEGQESLDAAIYGITELEMTW